MPFFIPHSSFLNPIFGPHGIFRAGSKLAFGDFGRYAFNGWNVFVGEYYTRNDIGRDTDQLWFHGKNGIYLTYFRGDNVIAFFDPSINNFFNVNRQVRANGITLISDERRKRNIKPLTGSLSLLQRLEGVSYSMENSIPVSLNAVSRPDGLSEKERESWDFFENRERELANSRNLRLGFLAQDLREVFPELVHEDSEGTLSVDYIGLIPVIVEALKEKIAIIEELRSRIEHLENANNPIIDRPFGARAATQEYDIFTLQSQEIQDNLRTATLYQNAPNPFSQSTEIRYYLPQNVTTAFLIIYDMNGRQIKQLRISERGEGSLVISGSELAPGMYLYALIADGVKIDVKRMILTE